MKEWFRRFDAPPSAGQLKEHLLETIGGERPGKVLLIPPDITRHLGMGGMLTAVYYEAFISMGAQVDVLPALGSHAAMTRAEASSMFGGVIPYEKLIAHDWRNGIETIGTIPASLIEEWSEGLLSYDIPVQISSAIVRGGYDLILCAGQVLPHEVAGMSSHHKHLFVGCGGAPMIDGTHFLGAVYGCERIMGKADTPVRRVFDEAARFIGHLPLWYALTVVAQGGLQGLFVSDRRAAFEQAAALSAQHNVRWQNRRADTCVVMLDPKEYRSTWLGNKAIYRTRMMLSPGAHLVVLAPGLHCFGEDAGLDRLIRRHGYRGRDATLAAVRADPELAANRSAAAHLIHGSSDGAFSITYATPPGMRGDVLGVGFDWMPIDEAMARYGALMGEDGMHTTPDGDIFTVGDPGQGLWIYRDA